MATNKPTGDNAGWCDTWTKRSKKSGESKAVKKPAKKTKAAKKFKGVRREKARR